MYYPDINIIVLNYNGKELLEKCLPGVVESALFYKGRCTVTVLDNCSTDGSVEFVSENYKEVKVAVSEKNNVLISYNSYIMNHVKEEIVILLNNDVMPKRDFIPPLIKYFEKNDTFFVSPKHVGFDGVGYSGGKHKMIKKLSFLSTGPFFRGFEKHIDKPGYTAYTGIGAFRKDIFLELGGFDKMFLPGYVEDVDLCYRGWKAGYKGYYEPASVVYHKGRETFKKFYDEKKMLVFSYRNTFLFVWKNMGVLSLAGHFFMLPLTVAVFVFTGRFLHVLGVVEAFQKAGSIKRQKSKLNETVAYKLANSDDEIVTGETKGNKRQDSEELGEPAGQGPAMCFPESALAHKLLDGLRGLEIGGSAHNPFGLNTKNVDYTGDMNTVFKREEVKICGKAMPVDIVAYGDKLPVQDNSQDFVVSSHVLEHFFDPIAALKEWYRVVKNGGYLFMIVPHKERTFDKEKERTTLKELIGRHEGRFKNRKLNYHDHFSFWITEDVVEIIKYLNWEIAEIMDTDDKVGNGFTVAVKVVK